MEQYNVTGMSCAACSARVEKAVSAVPGVQSCAVSLLPTTTRIPLLSHSARTYPLTLSRRLLKLRITRLSERNKYYSKKENRDMLS